MIESVLMYMKKNDGFTLLEMITVLALIVILIGLAVIALRPYDERNTALQVKSEAQLALDASATYVLSTSNFNKDTLKKKLHTTALTGYQYTENTTSSEKRRFRIEDIKDAHGYVIGHRVILTAIINNDLTIEGTLDLQKNTMHLKGIGKKSSINSLVESGVLDS